MQWISPLLISPHLGINKFQYSFKWQMIWCDYWKFPWMFMCLLYHNLGNFFGWAMGHMCNVNMCIMFCKWLCSLGSWNSSFITTHWVGMEFNICWCTLKPLNFKDSTSKFNMCEINCVFFIHKSCNNCLDYIGSLDSSYGLKVFSPLCFILIFLMRCIFFLFWWIYISVVHKLFPFKPISTIILLIIITCFHAYCLFMYNIATPWPFQHMFSK